MLQVGIFALKRTNSLFVAVALSSSVSNRRFYVTHSAFRQSSSVHACLFHPAWDIHTPLRAFTVMLVVPFTIHAQGVFLPTCKDVAENKKSSLFFVFLRCQTAFLLS